MNRNDEMDIVKNYREAKYPKSQERIPKVTCCSQQTLAIEQW